VVPTPLPGVDLLAQGVAIRCAPLQALTGERGNLDFREVQPAAMLGACGGRREAHALTPGLLDVRA